MAIKTSPKTQKHYDQILSYMKIGETYKAYEIIKLLGLKNSRVRELLKQLVDRGDIESIGERRNRIYRKH